MKNNPLGASYWKLWTATAISNLGDGVSMVAYPWLASAVTRSPLLIAAAGFASRMPWLVFTLHDGVITDRFDRRKLIVGMDFRGVLTVFVGTVVFLNRSTFPSLNELTKMSDLKTNWPIYITLLVTAFLFGLAEVLRDNSAQTLMPSVVDTENLEVANGRMWSAESLTNSFIGPPLGSLLIGIAIFLPFYFDAGSFFFAVALIATLKGSFKPVAKVEPKAKINFKAEIKEGFVWLWAHPLLRPMAIILGSMNGLGTMVGAAYILFAQEVLHTSVFIFAVLGTAGAIGGTLGGLLAPKVSAKLGSGPSLWLALAAAPLGSLFIGLTSSWQVVWAVTVVESFVAILWNTITVSLRQSIIPSHLLGRVNSVYRFFAWGSIPIGMFIGGGLVTLMEHFVSQSLFNFSGARSFVMAAGRASADYGQDRNGPGIGLKITPRIPIYLTRLL